MTIFRLAMVLAFLGFATIANAAKPPQDQAVTTPALPGSYLQCTAVNVSTKTIDLRIDLFDASGSVGWGTGDFAAGQIALHSGGTDGLGYCIFSWLGDADDFLITVCNTDDFTNTNSCVNAN